MCSSDLFGTYIEVTPNSQIVWTNDEGDAGQTVTTVTFEEIDGKTLIQIHDRYPSKDAVDTGATGAMPEVLDQLADLLASMSSGSETN